MKKCNQANCQGELVLRESQYGLHWKCTKCGHIIDGKCKVCGSSRILTVYEGISVARCTNVLKSRLLEAGQSIDNALQVE